MVYDIAADNGKKFCECKKKGNDVILSTKQGDIELLDLMEQITNYRSAMKKRNKQKM